MLSFRCYLELCIKIFGADRSAPETHESGDIAACVGWLLITPIVQGVRSQITDYASNCISSRPGEDR